MVYNKNKIINILKIVTSIACVFLIAFCGIQAVSAYNYHAITVFGTTGEPIIQADGIDGLSISPAIIFNKTGDSITYKVVLTSSDGKDFQIKNVTDDNESTVLKTIYEYDNELNSEEKSVYITLRYSEYIPYESDTLTFDAEDIHITFDIDEPDSVGVPDTGGLKFIKSTGSASATATPYIIITVGSLIILLLIVLPKKHRPKFAEISVLVGLIIAGGFAVKTTSAVSSKLRLEIKVENIQMVPNLTTGEDVVQVIFPNIFNNNSIPAASRQTFGNAIILKTMDDKYVLMDTGYKKGSGEVKDIIYSELSALQETENVVVDYMILSHLDDDHIGNAIGLLKDEKVTIKNVVVKNEVAEYIEGAQYTKTRPGIYAKILEAAANNHANVITSGGEIDTDNISTPNLTQEELNGMIENGDVVDDDYDVPNGLSILPTDVSDYSGAIPNSINVTMSRLSEGEAIQVGKYLKLYMYNTASVYEGKECKRGYGIAWTMKTTSPELYKNSENEYVYFDAADYPNIELRTTTNLPPSGNDVDGHQLFFAKVTREHNICQSNPNSYAVFAETKSIGSYRYMYFPGDLENAGDDMLHSGGNSSKLFSNVTFNKTTKKFETDITPYTILSENNVANAIYGKLEQDATKAGLSTEAILNNIVLYQESHHGGNNNTEAVWKLNLNRDTGIYAIQESSDDMKNATGWNLYKTYHYTLGNIPEDHKIRVGTADTTKTKCALNLVGEISCTQQ
jgi:hypothetical protein